MDNFKNRTIDLSNCKWAFLKIQQVVKKAGLKWQLFEATNFVFAKLYDFLVKITTFRPFLDNSCHASLLDSSSITKLPYSQKQSWSPQKSCILTRANLFHDLLHFKGLAFTKGKVHCMIKIFENFLIFNSHDLLDIVFDEFSNVFKFFHLKSK